MGRQMSERAEFHVRGQPLDGTPLHYTASGLDYVYLTNGYTVEDDPDYGHLVSIDAVDDLHRAIGMHIIRQPRELTGPEFRFLRKQMGFRQKDLAPRFGVDVQTVANYEKGRTIPATSGRLMRVLFVLWITPPDARAGILKQMVDAMQNAQATLKNISAITAPNDVPLSIVKQWQLGVADTIPTPEDACVI
jgi:DNA-binding transcriptional regulator YiaG